MLPRRAIARASVSALLAALPLLYVSLRRPPPAALAGDTAFWFLTSNCVVAAIFATAEDADEPGGGGRVKEEVASTGGNSVEDLLNHQHGEEDEVATVGEPSANMHNAAAMVNGQGGGEIASPTPLAFDETAAPIPVGKLGIIKVDDEALLSAEPEPWAPKSLPEEEEEAADDEEDWPPDVVLAQDNNGVAAAGDGRLRGTATEGSKQAADSSEYWELSDEELNRRVENFIARFNREMRLQIEQELATPVEI